MSARKEAVFSNTTPPKTDVRGIHKAHDPSSGPGLWDGSSVRANSLQGDKFLELSNVFNSGRCQKTSFASDGEALPLVLTQLPHTVILGS